jgi:O-glycosyl hydrolase
MVLRRLRIVVFPETTKAWMARCLEHDLAAVGRTAEAATDALVRVASAHIAYDIRHGRQPLSGFGTAPRSFWHAFAGASAKSKPMELVRAEPEGDLSCLVTVMQENPATLRRMPPYRIA